LDSVHVSVGAQGIFAYVDTDSIPITITGAFVIKLSTVQDPSVKTCGILCETIAEYAVVVGFVCGSGSAIHLRAGLRAGQVDL